MDHICTVDFGTILLHNLYCWNIYVPPLQVDNCKNLIESVVFCMKEYCYVIGVKESRDLRYISCFDAEGILLCDDAAEAIKWDCEEAAQLFVQLIGKHYVTDGFGDFWIRSLVVKVYPME